MLAAWAGEVKVAVVVAIAVEASPVRAAIVVRVILCSFAVAFVSTSREEDR